MAFVKIIIHAVWGTKNREPLLNKNLRFQLIGHMIESAKSKGIIIDRLNGASDHLHCLFSLNTDMSVAKTLMLIKGESAYWLNRQNLIKRKFEWADEYFAASVSASIIPKVRSYIDNQEEHHMKKTFEEEYQEFLASMELIT